MTSNSIKAQDAQTRRDELEETRRHNRNKEKIAISDSVAKHLGNIGNIAKTLGKFNDPSWYNADPQLVKDTASIPYGRPLGTATGDVQYYKHAQPGVATLFFAPTIGMNRTADFGKTTPTVEASVDGSLAATAAKALYAYVRHANSGSANYDAPDLFQYVLSIDSLLMCHALLTRLYSIAKDAKAHDRYFPKGFVQSLGFDNSFLDSLLGDLAGFRAFINVLATKINAFYYPSQLTYFTRHYWMCQNIFKDQNLKRSQHYMFMPEFVFIYNEIEGQLKPIQLVQEINNNFGHMNAVDAIKATVTPIIDVLLSSESIGIMSGDILKAFNDAALIGLGHIDENFHIEPIYSAEVLSQIDSAILPGVINVSDPKWSFSTADGLNENLLESWTVWQDNHGNLWQSRPNVSTAVGDTNVGPYVILPNKSVSDKLKEQATSLGVTINDGSRVIFDYDSTNTSVTMDISSAVINQYKDDVSPDDTMVSSRLTSAWVSSRYYGTTIPWTIPTAFSAQKTATEEETSEAEKKKGRSVARHTNNDLFIWRSLLSCGSEVLLYAVTVRLIPATVAGNMPIFATNLFADGLSQTDWSGLLREWSKFDWAPRIRYFEMTKFRKNNGTQGLNFTMTDVGMSGSLANYASVNLLTLNGMHTVAILSQLGVPYFRRNVGAKRSGR